MTEPTLRQQIASVKRELRMREINYPKFVLRGSMKGDQVQKELDAMHAVLQTLLRLEREQAVRKN